LPRVEGGVIVYEVKIGLDAVHELGLKVGMSASADIVIDERTNVLVVPSRAVGSDNQGNALVKVMVNGQIEERRVVRGISDGFQTEIVDGLEEGERVVRNAEQS
jgi:multidrug efflux pump subunit AcrA (membrane-fusion protein)